MKTLIKSVKVIAPKSPFHNEVVDLLLENGTIAKISPSIDQEADKTIEIENLHASLGWFDSSVSFGEPGYEERETIENGLQTAAKSGFTVVGLNPDNHPVTDIRGAVDYLKQKSVNKATSLFPIGALTQKSKGEELAELYDMAQAGAIAFGDYKKSIANPNLLKIALQYAQGFEGLIQTFPYEKHLGQNGVVHEGIISTKLGLKGRPSFAEEIQIARNISILEYTGGKLHFPTISTARGVQLIQEAKLKGLDVSCSVAVHNLFFTDEMVQEFDSDFKVNPPLRTEENRKALIEGVKNGLIDLVTSDHRPMNIERKKLEFEQAFYGSLGLESAFGALNQLFGVEKTIELLTSGRKRFGIDVPQFKEGEKAELAFFEPSEPFIFKKKNIFSSSQNSMFLNTSLKGKPLGVLANNHLILNQ